jgi:transposase
MTLRSEDGFSIPEETARVAHAAYPKGHRYLTLRDLLGTLYQDQSFAHLFPHNGRPAEAPWRLALITVLQFLEELPDRQAADAVRGRIDWKYLLGLPLDDPGFDFSVLSDFRARLVQGGGEQLLLDALLQLFKEHGWLTARGRQRTDSTHILAKVRAINRLMCVGETLRSALNSLAIVAGDWLLDHSQEEWLYRYGHRIEEPRFPKAAASRVAAAETIGRDGWALLSDVFAPTAPAFLREIPAVELLRRVWVQNYRTEEGRLHWRDAAEIPPARDFLSSPYDRHARYGKKYSLRWTGYKVHLTETCEADQPHLIVHVATTPAATSDVSMTGSIHAELQHAQLLPSQQFLDAGYVNAEVLAESHARFGIDVVSPVHPDVKWQATTEGGIDASQFLIDWEHHRARCPQGHLSASWTPAVDNRTRDVIKIRFSTRDCQACPLLARCTSSRSRAPRRLLTVRPQVQYQALQAARRRQTTSAFSQHYALRSGIEATMSQGVRALGLRRSRYSGLSKTHLQHMGTAAAINLLRVVAWLDGDAPAPTRVSAFQRLFAAA